MNLIWGIILISITLKCWIGQIIITLSPKMAETIKIIEPKSDVDQTYFTYIRSEAIWGAISLWILPITGILLIINNAFWTYFGLVGGGIYLCFTGYSIVSRLTMQKRGINIGSSRNLKVTYIFLTFWGLIALVTIIMAITTLKL